MHSRRASLAGSALFLILALSISAEPPQTRAVSFVNALLAENVANAGVDISDYKSALKRFECVSDGEIEATSIVIAGDHAFVELLVHATANLPWTHTQREFPPRWRVQLQRDGDDWRVVRIESMERNLALAIASTEPATQEALLGDCDAVKSSALVERLVDLGVLLGSKAQFPREERIARVALGVADELNDPLSRARALWLLGRARDSQDAYDEAVVIYNESHDLAVAGGDRETEGRALVGRGSTHVYQYDWDNARPALEAGLAIALSVHDYLIADNAHLGMATIHILSSEYIDALRDLARAVDYAEKAGDRVVVAAATANAGIVFSDMNNHALAADRLREAIEVYRQVGNMRGVVRNLRNLAEVEASNYQFDESLQHLDQVEAYLKKQPNDRISAFAATTRAMIHLYRKDPLSADHDFARALELAAKINERRLSTVLTNGLAHIRLAQHRYREAAELGEKALDLAAPIPALQPLARLDIARAYVKLGRIDDAVRMLRAAVETTESQLTNVPGTEDEQQLFYKDKSGPYYEMFNILVARHEVEAALQWVERSRSRSLIEYLGRNRVDADRDIISADERKEELRRAQEIVTLNRKLREVYEQPAVDRAAAGRLENEVGLKRRALEDYRVLLYTKHPELMLSRGALPRPSLSEVQRLIPPNGAIVEYAVALEDVWAIVIRRTGRPRVVHIDVPLYELEHRVDAFMRQVTQRDLGARTEARALYRMFLAPIEPLIRSSETLCIIPDGPLWKIPFQALIDSRGRYTIERHTIFYAPSLSLLSWRANHPTHRKPPSSILVVANPRLTEQTVRMARAIQRDESLAPLPDAEKEAKEIRTLYGDKVRIVTGEKATEAFVKRNAGRYRMIHLATHAEFDDTSPLSSHLLLAAGKESTEDGLLEAREIMNLNLAPDLVVLSSCETGRGEVRGGDGLVGMSWALLVAGCPTSVVSQWKVGSASTAKLMIEFHRRLARVPPSARRRTAARALREASLAMMRIPQYRDPWNWSGFVVMGSGW